MKECDQAFACKATFPTDQGVTFEQIFGATADACYMSAAEFYDAGSVEAAITGGTIAFDAAAASACLAGITAGDCATFWTAPPEFPAACNMVLQGKVADGGACKIDFECTNLQAICDDATKKCTVPADPAPRSLTQAIRDAIDVTR
jgi:hypothetical protein